MNGMSLSDAGIISFSVESIKPDGSSPALMGFINGVRAAEWTAPPHSIATRAAAIQEHYRTIFPIRPLCNQRGEGGVEDGRMMMMMEAVGYKEKIWSEDPWQGGGPCCIPGPCAITKYKLEHRQPFASDRVFIAGTESAFVMAGYLDGAVEAGERAARNVLVKRGLLDAASSYETISQYPPSPQMPFISMEISQWEKMLAVINPRSITAVMMLSVVTFVGFRVWKRIGSFLSSQV